MKRYVDPSRPRYRFECCAHCGAELAVWNETGRAVLPAVFAKGRISGQWQWFCSPGCQHEGLQPSEGP